MARKGVGVVAVTARSEPSVELPVDGVWILDVEVTDADGSPVSVAPTVTITLPDATSATPTPTETGTGAYRVEYVLADPGRYIARAVAASYGAADFAAYASATVAAADMPDLDDVLNYLGWDEDNPAGDAQEALDAQSTAQRNRCNVGAVYGADLRGALYRRVARHLAMKGIPLAVLRGDGEGGQNTVLPARDPVVRDLEAPHRKLVMG